MSHHDEHENLTFAEFLDEYWQLMFFGLFFLFTMFLPLLAMPNKIWFMAGAGGTLLIAVVLLLYSTALGRQPKSH